MVTIAHENTKGAVASRTSKVKWTPLGVGGEDRASVEENGVGAQAVGELLESVDLGRFLPAFQRLGVGTLSGLCDCDDDVLAQQVGMRSAHVLKLRRALQEAGRARTEAAASGVADAGPEEGPTLAGAPVPAECSEEVTNMIASIFTFIMNLGGFLGPLVGSPMIHSVGFRGAAGAVGMTMIAHGAFVLGMARAGGHRADTAALGGAAVSPLHDAEDIAASVHIGGVEMHKSRVPPKRNKYASVGGGDIAAAEEGLEF
jgi:hypothetical protein